MVHICLLLLTQTNKHIRIRLLVDELQDITAVQHYIVVLAVVLADAVHITSNTLPTTALRNHYWVIQSNTLACCKLSDCVRTARCFEHGQQRGSEG